MDSGSLIPVHLPDITPQPDPTERHELDTSSELGCLLSCAAVVMTRSGKLTLSHTFFGLSTLHMFLTERGGVRSIMVSTLLAALQQACAKRADVISQTISAIITKNPHVVEVATSRVPSFGNDYQSPAYGFRALGPLLSLISGPMLHPEAVDQSLEILAVHSIYDPSFLQVWGPLGVDLQSHFILIFIVPSEYSNIPGPPRPTPISPSPPFWNNWNGFEMPPQSVTGGSPAVSRPQTSWSNVSGGSAAVSRQTSWSDSSQQDVIAPLPPSHNTSALTPSCDLHTIFETFGVVEAQLADATCVRRGTLWEMVQNYSSMFRLLSNIGLPDSAGNMKVIYAGGRVLASSEVLESLGWVVESYKHKSSFGWAAEASKMQWKGEPPPPTDTLYNAYHAWLGIRQFWGPTGPIATGQPPQLSSDIHENAAYQLKQQHIYDYKKTIQRNLVPLT